MFRYGWLITVVGLVVVLVLLIVSRGNLSSVEADLDAAEQQNTSLSSQLQQAQTDKSQLQADLDTASADLAEIQAVFPPTNFSSPLELESWLASNVISLQPPATTWEQWYSKALQLQAEALADGFIVSVDYDYFFDETGEFLSVWNIAIIDGTVWFWDPEFDEPLQDDLLGSVG
jgi:type II secretory pathway pseudopilin PulG